MTPTIRDILQDLERTLGNVLALSDDIWLKVTNHLLNGEFL